MASSFSVTSKSSFSLGRRLARTWYSDFRSWRGNPRFSKNFLIKFKEVYKLSALFADFYVEDEKTIFECKRYLDYNKIYEAITEMLTAREVLLSKFGRETHKMIILCKNTRFINSSHFKILRFWNMEIYKLNKEGIPTMITEPTEKKNEVIEDV